MMTEEEIADIFDRVAQDLDFPGVQGVIGGAERRGRRLRARRRALLAAGSAATAAALVVAGIAAVSALPRVPAALDGPSPASTSAPSGSPAPSATAVASPTPGRTPSPGPTPASDPAEMTSAQVLAALKPMLPAGSTISDVRDDLVGPAVEFNYNDGQGAVDFMFSIEHGNSTPQPLSLVCSGVVPDEGPRPAGALPQSCTVSTDPHGDEVMDWVTYADTYGFYGYRVTLEGPDGVLIWLQVGNGVIGTTPPQVNRAVPPGSFTEWNAIIENPVWQ